METIETGEREKRIMSLETKELLNKLLNENDISAFLADNEDEFINIDLTGFINDVLAQKDLKLSEVVKNSGQSGYVYKVINGVRKPSRNVLLGIAIGMKLSVNETQFLLRIAKQATLDPIDKRDSVLIFAIKSEYDITQTNKLLGEMNQ